MSERSSDDVRAEARIEGALRALGADDRPPPGWEARVLASARPPWWRRWWSSRQAAFSGALAAAALLAIVVIWRPWRGALEPPELAVLVERQGGTVRGDAVHVGDVVRVAARRGAAHRAIWIYRDPDQLVAACPGGAGCTDEGGALAAAFTVELVGTYTVVALWSERPIAAPEGTRDEALAAAERSGAARRVESIVVN